MAFKNISITLKNENMEEAITKHVKNECYRNRSAYLESLVWDDIKNNGTEEVKKLIGIENEPA